ncbi:MAG: peptidyl-prolyl cis-trans isomerase [Coprococcus sp.]
MVEVGDEKVTADVANFFARYQQAQFETTYSSYLGDDFWGKEVTDGKTYEENYKDSIMDSLEEMYILDEHKDDYKVSLSDDEEKSIEDAAKKFTDSNDSAAKDAVSGDEKTVKKVLELLTLQKKMETAMTADVDTNVSDEEAAQKKMQYVLFSTKTKGSDGNSTDMSDDEKAEVKKKAEDFQKDAASAEDFSVFATAVGASATDLTFDSDTTSPNEDLIKAADKLKEGEVTDVIEADNGYYICKSSQPS